MKKLGHTPAPDQQLVLFTSQDGAVSISATMERESVWLSQAQMADLFGKERSVITKHIRNAFNEGEIDEISNVHFLHIPHSDKPVAFYNLDVIISVGYGNRRRPDGKATAKARAAFRS